MAFNFRYYEKKRGHRRTGSRTFGSAGEAVFFAVLLVLGCAGVAAGVLFLLVPEWRVNHGFVEHTCKVLDQRVAETRGNDGTLLYRPEIRIRYEVNGETHHAWAYDIHMAYSSRREKSQAIVDQFHPGESYTCWYDPIDPQTVVLVRGCPWWVWLVFIVPVSFVVIGTGGLAYTLIHWGRSAERRAAAVQRARAVQLFELGTPDPQFPSVPDPSDIASSPGTKLVYRLPLARSPGWLIFGLLAAAVVWNGFAWFFGVTAVQGIAQGRPDWLLILFALPFVVICVGLLVLFVRQLLVTTVIGPTLVEISAHPLYPGGQYEILVSQSGRLKVKSLEVALVCDEEAVYRQGTNARTESREVYRHSLFHEEGFEIAPAGPFEKQCLLDIPPGAMHSFKASHNEVRWRISVRGDVADWPSFERSFPVIVYPPPRDPVQPTAARSER